MTLEELVEAKKKKTAEAKFEKARKQLLVISVLSALNMVLLLFESKMSFLFSAILPTFFLQLGKLLAQTFNNSIFSIISIFLAIVFVLVYAVCYFIAKKSRVALLVALIIFIADTLFLVYLLTQSFSIDMLLVAGFHAWAIAAVAPGVSAWRELKQLARESESDTPDELEP